MKGFELIPNKSEPRSVWGIISDYDSLTNQSNKLEKRLIKAYFRMHKLPRWAVEKAAEKEWSRADFSKMLEELRESIKDE